MNNYSPQFSNKIWYFSSGIVLISFLAITLVPWILFDEISYSPTLLITWLTATAIIFSLTVSFENLRELKYARIHEQLPKLTINEIEYTSDPHTVNDNTHSSHTKYIIENVGRGKAYNFNSDLYLLDADNIQWIKQPGLEEEKVIKPDDSVSINLVFGNMNVPSGDSYHLLIVNRYYDSFGEKHTEFNYYKYIGDDNFQEVIGVEKPNLDDDSKFLTVKNKAEEKAKAVSKKLGEDISVDVEFKKPNNVHITIKKNDEVVNYRERSLIFTAKSLIDNAFFAVEYANA